MPRCRVCSSPFDDAQSVCPVCGNAVTPSGPEPPARDPSPPQDADSHPSPTRARTQTSHARRDPSSAVSSGRFLPGTILADRYRIIAPLGKGGMGEVYRADDLKLGQAVALKLLPEDFNSDESRVARFLGEVKIARRVSHPNVCRVYDIGDVDGQHFISMEYVDGEDLASLLRRIGRLPEDKAVQIARELCAGMAAAHDKGVLHRDLKPANVMIDGEGRVSVTDFGLAAISGELSEDDVLSGTPAYMAPEQLAGSDASVKSDIYALGLILYEMLTGKRAYDGHSLADMSRLHRDSTPATPSSVTPGLDPLVERVVMRCLDPDPQKRPASALQVAAALPGGDPLAAALAAGETPSPQMVAAAGSTEGMNPRTAWLCLGGILAGILLISLMAGRSYLVYRAPIGKPPAVMAERARAVAASLGYTDPARDEISGLATDQDYLRHRLRRANREPFAPYPTIFRYWYRSSPRNLVPVDLSNRPDYSDPPVVVSGMRNVVLDADGHLLSLLAVPPQRDTTGSGAVDPDWEPLFAAAGLDAGAFTPAPPQWNFTVAADTRAAWVGNHPRVGNMPVRLEAAAWKGQAVAFDIIWPWSRPSRMESRAERGSERLARLLNVAIFLVVLVLSALVAVRNVRRGRTDRPGAVRLGIFMAATQFLAWLVNAHHMVDDAELALFVESLAQSLFMFGMAALFYLAIEPYVRRLYPTRIITWVRVLEGRFRDPQVGRDILIGCLCGTIIALSIAARSWIPGVVGPDPDISALLTSPARTIAILLSYTQSSVFNGLVIMALYLIFRVLLRRESLAMGVAAALLTVIIIGGVGSTIPDMAAAVVFTAMLLTLLLRFGLLSAIAGFLMMLLANNFPVALGQSNWMMPQAVVVQLLAVGLAVYAFVTALGKRKAFRDSVLDE